MYTVVKLDIEGGELEALKGAINTINRCRPIITFEYLKHLNHLKLHWLNLDNLKLNYLIH